MMATAVLGGGSTLIPGAYERRTRATSEPRSATTTGEAIAPPPPALTPAGTDRLVATRAHPATRTGQSMAVLSDLALTTVVVFALTLAPLLLVQALAAAADFALNALGLR